MTEREVLDAVAAATDRGEPLRPRDLLKFDPATVRRLFDAGELTRAELRRGAAIETVILASPPLPVDDDEWTAEELSYLDVAYEGGVTFAAMARALDRNGGEILQQAWARKLVRRRVEPDEDWRSHVPGWKIARLRALLDEAQFRGLNAGDAGDGIEHRALRRRFARGRAQVGGLGRHFHRWTDGEVAVLKEERERGRTIEAIARKLHRTPVAVSTKIGELDLGVDTSWREDEDRIVVEAAARGLTNREIAKLLPRRSHLAVKARAKRLVGDRAAELWTEDERRQLREAMAAGANMRDFARRIGRGISGVRWQCRALGLAAHPNAVTPYTEAEDRRIRDGWAARERPRAIAADLGRTVGGIYNRAFKLGLTKEGVTTYRVGRVMPFEIEFIRVRVRQNLPAREIARQLGRSHHMVYRIAAKNGIGWPTRGPKPKARAA